MTQLTDKRIAMVVNNYVEEAELAEPLKALQDAGAKVEIIAPEAGEIQAMEHDVEKGDTFHVDRTIDETDFSDYDALVLPGGAVNADRLRTIPKVKEAIKLFMSTGRPLAAICHAPWVLISAGMAKGRRLTSFATLQDDLRNAGADWVDEAVVIDKNLITSRQPDDIPQFSNAIISMLAA